MQITGDPPVRLLLSFQEAFPEDDPAWILQAPGRDMWVAASRCADDEFTLVVPDLDAHSTFNYRSAKTRSTVLNRPLPAWARYPAGVLIHLRDSGLDPGGLQIVLAGKEPPGPRYHHALGIAVASLCLEVHERDYQADQLIELVEQVRRDYVEA